MKKIPTLFRRNENHEIYDRLHQDCTWVADGQGFPTLKIDGTCCRVLNAGVDKRLTLKASDRAMARAEKGYIIHVEDLVNMPANWQPASPSPDGGKWPGWVPVTEGPEDRYFVEGRVNREADTGVMYLDDGTYELVGPKVQGNPYGLTYHTLMPHGIHLTQPVPRTFEGLRQFLTENPIEGVVFWWPRPAGIRMAKIKRRDYGLDWPAPGAKLPNV